jgi:glycosyltransferase involved in cell wall biosynthesis
LNPPALNSAARFPPAEVVLIYQRMLPYHKARFRAIAASLATEGKTCLALEVAGSDASYGQLDDDVELTSFSQPSNGRAVCLFPNHDYLQLAPKRVADAVECALRDIAPAVLFAPAPAFAEGAGALHYKVRHGVKLILMDDAWAATDRRSWLPRLVKRFFYSFVDGGFFPAPLHGDYFAGMNIPYDRQYYAVNAVGTSPTALSESATLPCPDVSYVLFVGRLIARKGLGTVLRAFAVLSNDALHLVVVGDGPERQALEAMSQDLGLEKRVLWMGTQRNTHARRLARNAVALVVPSDFEQWGLVVNEAWMAGTLVLGSQTVGALQATKSAERNWMLLPVGDVSAWRMALLRLLALPMAERTRLIDEGFKLAEQFSLDKHVESTRRLMALSVRPRPFAVVGWVACMWRGKVAVW